MATKSDVVSVIAVLIMFDLKILQVPLGILFFNENKTDEMCSVLKDLYKYVPKKNCKVTYHLPDQDFECSEELHHRTLLGGDQLTVSRCRSAKMARCNEDIPEERFDGFIPVVEDWHARLTLMRVSMI